MKNQSLWEMEFRRHTSQRNKDYYPQGIKTPTFISYVPTLHLCIDYLPDILVTFKSFLCMTGFTCALPPTSSQLPKNWLSLYTCHRGNPVTCLYFSVESLGPSSTEPQAAADHLEDLARSSQPMGSSGHQWLLCLSRSQATFFYTPFIRDIGGRHSTAAFSTIQATLTTSQSNLSNTPLVSLMMAAYD